MSAEFLSLAKQLAETGRFLANRGWAPATSSNYSVLLPNGELAISRSGIDKYKMLENDVIRIDHSGNVITPKGERASAETLIHLKIYSHFPNAKAVLHTHSPLNTRLSLKHVHFERLSFSGYEMLKAFEGINTHEATETVPIIANSQDMLQFCQNLEPILKANPFIHGFLIAGHGLYTWASDISTARRHVEAYEFLFECLAHEQSGI